MDWVYFCLICSIYCIFKYVKLSIVSLIVFIVLFIEFSISLYKFLIDKSNLSVKSFNEWFVNGIPDKNFLIYLAYSSTFIIKCPEWLFEHFSQTYILHDLQNKFFSSFRWIEQFSLSLSESFKLYFKLK